jgi:hypothetical protein
MNLSGRTQTRPGRRERPHDAVPSAPRNAKAQRPAEGRFPGSDLSCAHIRAIQPAFATPTHRLTVEITSQSTTKIKVAA